jgi:hypothetical protein
MSDVEVTEDFDRWLRKDRDIQKAIALAESIRSQL